MEVKDRWDATMLRDVANQAFSRASGAPLREHNRVRLLKDAQRELSGVARRDSRPRNASIHFEMYIIHEDDQGRLFADALIEKARQGVHVRLLYDWMGGFGKTSRAVLESPARRRRRGALLTTRRASTVRSAGSAAITAR